MCKNIKNRFDGKKFLSTNIGEVYTQQLIIPITREPFDYTKWQDNLFEDMSLEGLGQKAMAYYNARHSNQ